MSLLFKAVLFCIMVSCDKPDLNDSSLNENTMPHQKQYTWLALGDSYTIGETVNAEDRFPAQTIALLQHKNLQFSLPQYIATTGWTTTDLLNAIAEQNLQGAYDVVSLLIGVNDQYQNRDTTGYRKKFTLCLQKAIALAGNKINHVFVVSIPDYSVTPFAANTDTALIKKQIDEFNAINREVTLSYNINYIYITDLTREAKTDASLIANDGLHPSAKEYAKWAALLAPQIEKLLE